MLVRKTNIAKEETKWAMGFYHKHNQSVRMTMAWQWYHFLLAFCWR
jgi:hypothetical protein